LATVSSMEKPETETFWGDETEETTEVTEVVDGYPSSLLPTETPVDADGVKKRIVFGVNGSGQLVRVTQKLKVSKKKTKVNKRIFERKKWSKFGEVGPGLEAGVTITDTEEIPFELTKAKRNLSLARKNAESALASELLLRTPDGSWSIKTPNRFSIRPFTAAERRGKEVEGNEESGNMGGPKKYVIPSLRGSSAGPGEQMKPRGREEVATLRVTNLSEDTKDGDLYELFRPFGQISRVYFPKDKLGLPKGFAFVNFAVREDAARALEKLSGVGYNHLILHLEWAKPSQ